jgi:SAM-dependent methyltransferase
MNTDQIKDYYNAMLDYFKTDDPSSPRHTTVKNTLSKIIKPGMNVLDLGCGTGISSKAVAEMGARVEAVDIADDLIKYARMYNQHDNIRYSCFDITEVDYYNAVIYDVILLIDCLEHILPEKIIPLLNVLKRHSHNNTTIYLNLPDGRYTEYLRLNAPEKLQIVDEAYRMEDILRLFKLINFECVYVNMYGVKTDLQYNEYVFVPTGVLYNNYKQLKQEKGK